MKRGFLVTTLLALVVLPSLANATVIIPGVPVAGTPNPGSPTVIFQEGGGIGVQPITTTATGSNPISTTPGDVVILSNSAGGDVPSNFAAVVDFFNPADPTGVLGLNATEYQTYYGGNVGTNTFADLTLTNAIYVSEAPSSDFPAGDIGGTFDVFGPSGNILTGQLGIFLVAAAPQAPLISAVPEPATWTMMIVGFGFVGGTLRMRATQRFNASVKV